MAYRPFDPEAQAIDVTRQQALRRVEKLSDLPDCFARRPDIGEEQAAGWIFTWHQPDGAEVPQFRSDHPPLDEKGEELRYLFPKDCPGLLSIPPDYKSRVMDPAIPLVIVEGSAQHLAVASALSDEPIAVVGIGGCNGWSKERAPIRALEAVPMDQRVVYVLPDADMASNGNVWKGITGLASHLKGEFLASVVRFVAMPAQGKDGADDVLGRSSPARRTEMVKRWLNDSSEEPCAPPPDKLLSYDELIDKALDALKRGDRNTEMDARAQIMGRFRRKDEQITADIINRLSYLELGGRPGLERGQRQAVDLANIPGLDFQVDGFTFEKGLGIVFASRGVGKTTAMLAMAFAHIEGKGFLDREGSAPKGKVLFIASDSGAPALNSQLAGMGLAEHPACAPGPDQRFFVWAHDPATGQEAWGCDIRGLIELLHFVVKNEITMVIADSGKAICTKGGLSYRDNDLVTALLVFIGQVVCRHCSFTWISHDGTEKGSAAGAKAWVEVPSIVHEIQKSSNRGDRAREWTVSKCRVSDQERSFVYELIDGQLCVAAGVEVIGDATEAVKTVMVDAYKQGKEQLGLGDIQTSCMVRFDVGAKTVANTLTKLVQASERWLVRKGRGRYALAPKTIQALKLPLIRTLSREDLPQTPYRERDMDSSRENPSGVSGSKPSSRVTPEGVCREEGEAQSGTEVPRNSSQESVFIYGDSAPPSPDDGQAGGPSAQPADLAPTTETEPAPPPTEPTAPALPWWKTHINPPGSNQRSAQSRRTTEQQSAPPSPDNNDKPQGNDNNDGADSYPKPRRAEPQDPQPSSASPIDAMAASLAAAFNGEVLQATEPDIASSTLRLSRADLERFGCRVHWLPEDHLSPSELLVDPEDNANAA